MESFRKKIETIFNELDKKIEQINLERRSEGLPTFPKGEVKLLGQMSLLSNDNVSLVLSLAHTGDMDAFLKMDYIIEKALKEILVKHGFIYDDDSYLIWIPNGTTFDDLFDLEHVTVKVIDPESALVSKAIKAPEKNKQLIREAIASDKFPNLVERILTNFGKLEDFV